MHWFCSHHKFTDFLDFFSSLCATQRFTRFALACCLTLGILIRGCVHFMKRLKKKIEDICSNYKIFHQLTKNLRTQNLAIEKLIEAIKIAAKVCENQFRYPTLFSWVDVGSSRNSTLILKIDETTVL